MTGVRGVRFATMGITPKGKNKQLQANWEEWGESFSFCCEAQIKVDSCRQHFS